VAAAEQHALYVDVHRALVGGERRGDGVVVVADHHARVVVQHVERAERRQRRPDRLCPRLVARDVEGRRERAAARGLDLGHDGGAVGHVGNHDVRSFAGEGECRDATEAARRARDDRGLSLQARHGRTCFLSVWVGQIRSK